MLQTIVIELCHIRFSERSNTYFVSAGKICWCFNIFLIRVFILKLIYTENLYINNLLSTHTEVITAMCFKATRIKNDKSPSGYVFKYNFVI